MRIRSASALGLLTTALVLAGCSTASTKAAEQAIQAAVDKAVEKAVAEAVAREVPKAVEAAVAAAMQSTASTPTGSTGQPTPGSSTGETAPSTSTETPTPPGPMMPPGQAISNPHFPFPMLPYTILVKASVSYKPRKSLSMQDEVQLLAFTLNSGLSVVEAADGYEKLFRDKGFTIRSRSTSTAGSIAVTAEGAGFAYTMHVGKRTENQRAYTYIDMNGTSKTN